MCGPSTEKITEHAIAAQTSMFDTVSYALFIRPLVQMM